MEKGVLGAYLRRVRGRSQGSSPKKRLMESKVAPPHTSMAQNPAWSISSMAGIMSSVRMRVANRLWVPSRRVRSSIFSGVGLPPQSSS